MSVGVNKLVSEIDIILLIKKPRKLTLMIDEAERIIHGKKSWDSLAFQ